MAYYIIIRGPLGIGKTTIARKLAEILNADYISMDVLLEKHGLDRVDESEGGIPARNFTKANEIILPEVKQKLSRGKVVIFDGCFYHKEQIEHLLKSLDYKHYVFDLKAPLEICIDRDSKRKKSYGAGAATAVFNMVSRFDYGEGINTGCKTADEVVEEIIKIISK